MGDSTQPNWREDGQRYYRYSRWLKEYFGGPIYKACIDAGLGCPNLDGTISSGGCIFCDQQSFTPTGGIKRYDVVEQVKRQIVRWEKRYPKTNFLAYFQAGTNTYAPIDDLQKMFYDALDHPKIQGLVIGTRPDAVSDEVLDLLAAMAKDRYVAIEYGMQTSHDRTLRWINRGHQFNVLAKTVLRTRERGIHTGVHLILGLPGEGIDDMIQTAYEVGRLQVNAVKIHNLYIARNTPLEKLYNSGEISTSSKEDYLTMLITFLEHLDPKIVVQRVMSDIPDPYLVAPEWVKEKSLFLRELDAALELRDTWQGKSKRSTPEGG